MVEKKVTLSLHDFLCEHGYVFFLTQSFPTGREQKFAVKFVFEQ